MQPNEEDHGDNIENAFDAFEQTVDDDFHAWIVADEPKGPEDPEHPDDFDEAEVAVGQGNIHQRESHYYEVQLRPTVPQVRVAF